MSQIIHDTLLFVVNIGLLGVLSFVAYKIFKYFQSQHMQKK